MKRTLECVDCHIKLSGDLKNVLQQMNDHVQRQHGRQLVFDSAFYHQETWTRAEQIANTVALYPELMISA